MGSGLFLPLSRLRERVPNRAAVRRERALPIDKKALSRPPSLRSGVHPLPQAGEGKEGVLRRRPPRPGELAERECHDDPDDADEDIDREIDLLLRLAQRTAEP